MRCRKYFKLFVNYKRISVVLFPLLNYSRSSLRPITTLKSGIISFFTKIFLRKKTDGLFWFHSSVCIYSQWILAYIDTFVCNKCAQQLTKHHSKKQLYFDFAIIYRNITIRIKNKQYVLIEKHSPYIHKMHFTNYKLIEIIGI